MNSKALLVITLLSLTFTGCSRSSDDTPKATDNGIVPPASSPQASPSSPDNKVQNVPQNNMPSPTAPPSTASNTPQTTPPQSSASNTPATQPPAAVTETPQPATPSKTQIGNLDDLKNKMSDVPALAKPLLDRTAAIKYTPVQDGPEISYEDCLEVAKKIDANYPISAFNAVYKNGSSTFEFCKKDENNSAANPAVKYSFLNVTDLKNDFGIDVKYVITKSGPYATNSGFDGSIKFRESIFLDANYKMLQIQRTHFKDNESQGIQYTISTLDTNGNYYRDDYYGPGADGGTRYVNNQIYLSADGKFDFIQALNPRRSDKGNEQVLTNIYRISEVKVWDDFFIVLSHGWSGGFYTYGPDIENDNSKTFSEMTIKSVAGQQVCADGYSAISEIWTRYSSPTASSGFCSNDW